MLSVLLLPMDFSIKLLVETTPFDLRSSEGHGLFICNFSTLSVDGILHFERILEFSALIYEFYLLL